MREGLSLFSGQNFEGYFEITVNYIQKFQLLWCVLDCEGVGLGGLVGVAERK